MSDGCIPTDVRRRRSARAAARAAGWGCRPRSRAEPGRPVPSALLAGRGERLRRALGPALGGGLQSRGSPGRERTVTLLTTAVRWQTSAGAYSALLGQTLCRGAGPHGVRDYGSVLTYRAVVIGL